MIQPFAMETQALSAIGYVNAALELDSQLGAAGVTADRIFAAAANVTPAGLLLGLKALGRRTHLAGICPIRWADDRATDIAAIGNAAAGCCVYPSLFGRRRSI